MTPEQKQELARVHALLAETLGRLHVKHFIPSAKLTLLVRQPDLEDGDLLITDDNPKLIIAAIERLADTGTEHPPFPYTKPTIDRFAGERRFLSNFWPTKIEYDGHIYTSSEHAFQAAKAGIERDRQFVADSKTPGEAKRRGRSIKLRKDWESIKVDVMRQILKIKFAPDSELGRKLMATAGARLVEGNHWGDTFWGIDDRMGGDNRLGLLLMEIRTELLDDITRREA